MVIKKTTTTTSGGITIIQITLQCDEYLDETGTQELVDQMKQYADQELGGNP